MYKIVHTDLGTPIDSNSNVNYFQLGCPGLYICIVGVSVRKHTNKICEGYTFFLEFDVCKRIESVSSL